MDPNGRPCSWDTESVKHCNVDIYLLVLDNCKKLSILQAHMQKICTIFLKVLPVKTRVQFVIEVMSEYWTRSLKKDKSCCLSKDHHFEV